MRPGSRPNSRKASRSVVPSASVSVHQSSSHVPGDGRRAEQRLAEAGALLVGERDHLERERQASAAGRRRARAAGARPRAPSARRRSRRSARRRARCRGASRAAGAGASSVAAPPASSRPSWLPAASCRVVMPTSRIHSAASRFTRACSGERYTRSIAAAASPTRARARRTAPSRGARPPRRCGRGRPRARAHRHAAPR